MPDIIDTYYSFLRDSYDSMFALQQTMDSPEFKKAYAEWRRPEDPEIHLFETFQDFLNDLKDAMH